MGPGVRLEHATDTGELESVAKVFKCLGDERRLQILALLVEAPEEELNVAEMVAQMGISQPTVSHHLQIMVEAGLLERDKRGVNAFYSIADDAREMVQQVVTNIFGRPRRPARRTTSRASAAA